MPRHDDTDIRIKSYALQQTQGSGKIRRIALNSQGLIGSAPFGMGLGGAEAAIHHLSYIQLDSISVIERAHNHIWRSRVPNFKPEQSNQLLESATVFEYWAHAAAFIPINEYRYYLADKAAVRAGTLRKGYPRDRKLMKQVLKQVADEGPLASKDLEDRRTKSNGWWDWKPAKKAIEALYPRGRAYDLLSGRIPKKPTTWPSAYYPRAWTPHCQRHKSVPATCSISS